FDVTGVQTCALPISRNVTTAMTVAQARGVVLLTAMQAGLKIAEYTPMQIKQALTGYGKADKKQIQEMVRVVLNLKEVPRPDDAEIGRASCRERVERR